MSEFTKVIVTQGWLWAALLILMLLFALDNKCSWPLRFQLKTICATSLAVGLMFVGILLLVGSPIAATVAIDQWPLRPEVTKRRRDA